MFKRTALLFFFISFIPSLFSTEAYQGQGDWWVNLAGGGGYFIGLPSDVYNHGGVFALATGASFNYRTAENQFLTARFTEFGIAELDLDAIECDVFMHQIGGRCRAKSASAYDVSLLYGLIKKADYGYVSISAGPGLSHWNGNGITVTEHDGTSMYFPHTDPKTALSLALESQAFWTPTKYFGIGLIALGNVSGYSQGTILLALQMGHLN